MFQVHSKQVKTQTCFLTLRNWSSGFTKHPLPSLGRAVGNFRELPRFPRPSGRLAPTWGGGGAGHQDAGGCSPTEVHLGGQAPRVPEQDHLGNRYGLEVPRGLAIPGLGNFPPQPLPGGEQRALLVQAEPQGLGPPRPLLVWATPPYQSAPQISLRQRVWSDRLYLESEQSSTQDGWIH